MEKSEPLGKSEKAFLIIILVIVMLLVGMILGGIFDTGVKYRQGQIDALNGQIKYELKTNPDSTVTWHKK